MKIYVVYDSEGDHTKALAEAIAVAQVKQSKLKCSLIM